MTNAGLILALVAVTGGHGPRPGRCESCGVEVQTVANAVETLRQSPRPRARERAARTLRKADWQCHPDAVLALCGALMHDPDQDVRATAAGSLGRMQPRVPIAHETLGRSAGADPKADVRDEARDALQKLARRRCLVACRACGPVVAPPSGFPTVIVAPTIIPDGWMPLLTGEPAAVPPPPSSLPMPLPPALPDAPPPLPRPDGPPLEGPIGSMSLSV